MPKKLSFCSLLAHKNPLTEKLVKSGSLNPLLQKKWVFLTKNLLKLDFNAKKTQLLLAFSPQKPTYREVG